MTPPRARELLTAPQLVAFAATVTVLGISVALAAGGSLHIPEGAGGWLVLAATSAQGLVAVWVRRRELAGLTVLRGLSRVDVGRQSAPSLSRAAREILALPDRVFAGRLFGHCLGAVVVVVVGALAGALLPGDAVRLLLLTAGVAAPAAALAYLLTARRSRVAAERLQQMGLGAVALARALPAPRLALRLTALAAIAALSPLALLAAVAGGGPSPAALPLVATSAAMTVGLMAIAGLAGWSITRPVRALTDEVRRVAAGTLGTGRCVIAEDEVGVVGVTFAGLEASVAEIIAQLKRAGIRISSTTGELVSTSARHEAGAAEQVTALADTSSTTEELARSARQIAGNAGSVARMAEQTLEAAREGKHSADAFFLSMERMRHGNQAIADSVVKLNKRVQQVGKIVRFINELADKSDLLAVNAELEGTKAGEVGRGFSLVAAEIRRLAEAVMESTQQIGQLIDDVRDATHAAVMAAEAGVKASDAGGALSQRVSESLHAIHELAQQTSESVRSISLATHQQQTGTDQLVDAMTHILQATQVGSLATREVAQANEDLAELAGELKEIVGRFSVS